MAAFVRWRDDPQGPYIRLAKSGEKFFLRNPKPEYFRIPDMAANLAGINRYTGGGLSVAQHLVVGAEMAERFYPEHPQLPAKVLIHDSHEFAYGDVSSPLKYLLPGYKELELLAELAAEQRFDLKFIDDPLVKEVDVRMWLTERAHIWRNCQYDVSEDYGGPLTPFTTDYYELEGDFGPWSREYAEEQWLAAVSRRLPWVHW